MYIFMEMATSPLRMYKTLSADNFQLDIWCVAASAQTVVGAAAAAADWMQMPGARRLCVTAGMY